MAGKRVLMACPNHWQSTFQVGSHNLARELAAERLNLEVLVLAAPQSVAEAEDVAHKALVRADRPTALFCFSDSIAYGGYAAARALGLAIPGDVSIVGYDDHPVSRLLSPTLTTVDWDLDSIIRAAVQLVVTAIDGRPRRRRIVKPPTLRERESTGRPRTVS